MRRTTYATCLVAALALAGCAAVEQAPAALPEAESAGADAVAPPPTAVTVEDFDTTTAAERAEAAAAPDDAGAEVPLGTTIASLGDATQPGFWAETPLVTSVRPGRLIYEVNGRSVQVELRPSGGEPGTGTRVSLSAMRILEAPLAALPELTVTGL